MAPLEIQVGERYETLFDEMRASGYRGFAIDGQTYAVDELPTIDRRRKHDVEVVVDRVVVRHDARSRIADSVENALSLGGGVLRVAHPRDDVPEAQWKVDVHSQHFACDRCGRSFEPLSPHHFSFNSSLGWCPACEGLGTQVGANPAALLHDTKLTLRQGAIDLWPRADSRLFGLMLDALRPRRPAFPPTCLTIRLGAKHRRLIMHGTGEQWFDVLATACHAAPRSAEPDPTPPAFPVQGPLPGAWTKPATCRHGCGRGWSTWSTRSSAASAAAAGCGTTPRPCGCGAGRSTRSAAGRWANCCEEFRAWTPDPLEREIAGELIREIRNRLEFLVDVGLDYLTLARPAPTLSGGEMQRIRLAAQVGSGLCGVLYVLDEPTIGLHPRDNRRLLGALREAPRPGQHAPAGRARPRGAPGGRSTSRLRARRGRDGGEIVARGTPAQLARRRGSVTGPYLSGKKAIPVPTNRRMTAAEPSGATAGLPQQCRQEDSRKSKGGQAARGTRGVPASFRPAAAGSKSSAPGTTTSRTSTCESRWARSPW